MEFKEIQRFRQWWLWAILALAVLIPLGILAFQLFTNKAINYDPPDDPGGIISLALVLLVILLFVAIRLETVIDVTGITYRFFPVHLKWKHIPWDAVAGAQVRKYKPIGEYGGWGLRYGFGSGTALNISGNQGLQLVFKDGKKLLFGTRRPEEIRQLLSRLETQGLVKLISDPG